MTLFRAYYAKDQDTLIEADDWPGAARTAVTWATERTGHLEALELEEYPILPGPLRHPTSSLLGDTS